MRFFYQKEHYDFFLKQNGTGDERVPLAQSWLFPWNPGFYNLQHYNKHGWKTAYFLFEHGSIGTKQMVERFSDNSGKKKNEKEEYLWRYSFFSEKAVPSDFPLQ